MIQTLYIEEEVADHPRTQAICRRYPKATRIHCQRYGEIFNRKAQNFRLQKRAPALILARKFKNFVLEAPLSYNIGGRRNFYFSHMLNCIYDCRYCFLQGMYRSANYVLFVNYEDFDQAIIDTSREAPAEASYFFSGYDCDSLALEPVTGFVKHALPLFARHPNAWLELRTKSIQIRELLAREPIPNVVVAYSLSPEVLVSATEHKAPSLQRRLEAIVKLQRHGWRVGLRFDPLIYCSDYQPLYRDFFRHLFSTIEIETLHSVSLGSFRMPTGFFRNMVRLYPQERLFAGPMSERGGMVSYQADLEAAMFAFCEQQLLTYIPRSIYFPCSDEN